MNVLSLFDGMSCGQLALQRAGIKVDNYFASEIDKHAIQVTMKNFPNTIQLGDVTKWREWDLPKIDLVIGGSPCQGFSFAGKGLNFDDPRSKLFFEFADILNHYNPYYFLLENVKMKYIEFRYDGKTNALTTVQKDNVVIPFTLPNRVPADEFFFRYITPLECERLQTVPEGYTDCVSDTQRYRMLGNGWTVDVIAHIFKGLSV